MAKGWFWGGLGWKRRNTISQSRTLAVGRSPAKVQGLKFCRTKQKSGRVEERRESGLKRRSLCRDRTMKARKSGAFGPKTRRPRSLSRKGLQGNQTFKRHFGQ